jgi:phenylacetate-coenzyme A ligase PaaK-like adenylate-forming protein
MADYETLRHRHAERWAALQSEYFDRISWPQERLAREREERLRALILAAKQRSPWHRSRLEHIDADRVTEADLASIPPMTKHEMMVNFDAVLTDRRLTRNAVESHLEGLTDDAYLLDEFHAAASGGSSGTRGVFVYGWDGWAISHLTFIRFRRRFIESDPELGPAPPSVMIAAGKATHMTFAMARTFRGTATATPVPATLPLPEIVSRLNAIKPLVVNGYPTMLYALAHEARAGRLRIRPRMVGPNSEPLLPEMRRAMEEVWQCPILNVLGTTEGLAAGGCGLSRGMHLGEDTAIFELVDEHGNPVPPGIRAAKMYVTNLVNHVQPLIRYELTDEATLLEDPCPCGSSMRRIDDIEGRTDDVFVYSENVIVHPLVFRSRLGGERNVVEYQVRQTGAGADIELRTSGHVETDALAAALERDLAVTGVANPRVSVRCVDALDRQQTGKLKRFVPLSPA